MELTYIYQSCFVLRDNETVFVFDFFKEPEYLKGIVENKILDNVKKLYVFVSHSHSDHYNDVIFNWNKKIPNTTYIVSDDVRVKNRFNNKIIRLRKSEIYNDIFVFIKAFGSTDLGVSFFIKYKNKMIFHAGDLNNWHWRNEVSEGEALDFEKFFLDELNEIKSDISYLDIAMFPVDPRMEIDFDRGARQFIDSIEVKYFFPMHFMGEFNSLEPMRKYSEGKNVRFIKWENFGETIEID